MDVTNIYLPWVIYFVLSTKEFVTLCLKILLVISSTDGILQLLEKVPAGPLALARPHQQRLERVRGGGAAEGAELGRVRIPRQALG